MLVAIQLSVMGLYLPPLLSPEPPQTIISLPVIERRSKNILVFLHCDELGNAALVYQAKAFAQRLLRFGTRAAFLRLRISKGFGRGAPLICSEDPPAIARKCSLKSSRCIAASCSRLVGCVIDERLSACLAIDLPQQPTSRLPQAQPTKAGQ
jgi:hypothetical protein